jgi:hypothetical protein
MIIKAGIKKLIFLILNSSFFLTSMGGSTWQIVKQFLVPIAAAKASSRAQSAVGKGESIVRMPLNVLVPIVTARGKASVLSAGVQKK